MYHYNINQSSTSTICRMWLLHRVHCGPASFSISTLLPQSDLLIDRSTWLKFEPMTSGSLQNISCQRDSLDHTIISDFCVSFIQNKIAHVSCWNVPDDCGLWRISGTWNVLLWLRDHGFKAGWIALGVCSPSVWVTVTLNIYLLLPILPMLPMKYH